MKFGHFDDVEKEYVITTPQTPFPWINYLGCEEFFGLISNTAGGYCFYRDARLRRITRYRYNNIPADCGGRYFYVREGNSVWSPTWQPVRTPLDRYECRHGLGYTRILGERDGIRVEILFFVPLGRSCEVHRVRFTNMRNEARRILLFSFIEFCLWNAYDDMTNFQRNLNIAEVEVDGNVIYHKTEYRERRNHYAFYGVNQPILGFDTDRDEFLGLYHGLHEPQAVLEGRPRCSIAHGWAPIASHCLDVSLDPGETRELVFVLGYVENAADEKWERPGVINKEKARKIMAEFSTGEAVQAALDALKAFMADLLGAYRIRVADEKLARMVNIWNPYQCIVTFNLARSASYFESGIGRGIGFRDSNQDALGAVSMVPERVRARILDLAATQLPDGSAYHQYQPLTKRGNSDIGSGFNDDPLWLVYSTIAYIKETGDYTILDEQVPFNNDPGNSASLFDHLRRSLNHVTANLGPHGLPLIGRADWNDCLNLNCFSTNPDESFQTAATKEGKNAESILIGAMFVHIGQEYSRLCRRLGLEDEAAGIDRAVNQIRQALLAYGFDGEWFIRAYDDAGRKVGSKENREGQIFVEPQAYCTMAGVGVEEGLAQKAMDSVGRRLACDHGVKLLDPPFTLYDPALGEITSYPPGYKENGSVFCHTNGWVIIAETVLRRPDRAFDYYKRVAPAYREDISDVHRMEPYVYCQMIAGPEAPSCGEGKNSWLTGSAAWHYVAITQYILGVRPDFDGLVIDPCLPPEVQEVHVTRRFRGTEYRIRIRRTDSGTYRLQAKGAEVCGKLVRHADGVDAVEVYCEV